MAKPQWVPKQAAPATVQSFLTNMTPKALVNIPVAMIVSIPAVRDYLGDDIVDRISAKYGDGVLGDLESLDLATIAMAAVSRTDTSPSVPDEIAFICPTCGDAHVINLKD